jgi:hypothetical protein
MPQLERKGSLLLKEGFNIAVPAEYIKDTESPSNENMYVNRGVLSKRTGTIAVPAAGTVISGSSPECMGGREFTREDVQYNIRIGLDRIEQFNTGTTTWDNITGSDLTGTTDDLIDTAIPMLSGKRILCITNGIDAIRKYTATGNTADLGGSPPKAKFIQEYRTYLVCANILGGTDIAQRVQWSDTADPETWTGGNSGSVDLVEDGKDIKGMNVFGSFLCVHKETSIYLGRLVSSSSIFKFDRVATEAGTVANGTIINLPTGEQIFLSTDGLRIFNGILAPLIESPVNDEIRDGLSSSYAHKSWGVLVKEEDEVWVGVPLGDQTTGDTVYKFNYKTRVLYKDTRSNITAAWRFTNSGTSISWDETPGNWNDSSARWNDGQTQTSFPKIMLGDNTGLTVEVDNSVNNDNGSAISAHWQSKDFQTIVGEMNRWKELEIWAKGSSMTIEYSIDQGATWTTPAQSPLTLDSEFPPDTDPDIIYIDVVSSTIRFRFCNTTSGETFAIKQFIVGYTPRERRS